MFRIIALILLLSAPAAYAQEHPFNTKEWWNRLTIDSNNTAPKSIDTSIIIVTSRAYVKNDLRFMSEERGNGTLTYYFVYANSGKWHLIKLKNLKQTLQYVTDINKNWVVYTEGMGKIFPSELDRGMRMNAQYGVNVIMLDYPSITTTKSRIGNYFFAIGNAKDSYIDFEPVMNNIKQLKENEQLGNGRLSLFFHSMGNYLMRNIALKGDLEKLNDNKWVDNLILNSACVPQHHHSKWLNNIKFAKDVYVNYNPDDRVLIGAKIASKQTQLGNKAKPPLATGVHYVNFNPIVGMGHSNFLDLHGRHKTPAAAKQYYSNILNGEPARLNDTTLYRTSAYKDAGYEFATN